MMKTVNWQRWASLLWHSHQPQRHSVRGRIGCRNLQGKSCTLLQSMISPEARTMGSTACSDSIQRALLGRGVCMHKYFSKTPRREKIRHGTGQKGMSGKQASWTQCPGKTAADVCQVRFRETKAHEMRQQTSQCIFTLVILMQFDTHRASTIINSPIQQQQHQPKASPRSERDPAHCSPTTDQPPPSY